MNPPISPLLQRTGLLLVKAYADKRRKGHEFAVGEDILLKLHSCVQSLLVNRPSAKIAPQVLWTVQDTERIDKSRYKLNLSPPSLIHPGFHVSQVKPFTANYSSVFTELPDPVDSTAGPLPPEAILEHT